MNNRIVRFLVMGVTAAIVNLVSRLVLNWWMPFEVAVAIAYVIGMFTAYILSRVFVFDTSGRSVRSEFGRFAIVNAFALLLVWGISVGLARFAFPAIGFTWHVDTIAHIIGVGSPVLTSYFAYKHFVFRTSDWRSRKHGREPTF